MNITGQTILITGGGTGIGRALAEDLHARGNQIIITGRREAPLKAVVEANPGMAWASLDVANTGSIPAFVSQLLSDHPSLNVVINNAGVMVSEDLNAPDLAVVDAMLTTNISGPIHLTLALLPHLRQQAEATIINVTSGLAFVPLAATPTYNATKAALHSWTQSLRHQLRDTAIEVLELAPPAVATDLMPGHAENPSSMPLQAYRDEVMALIDSGQTPQGEILVQRVLPLRHAESTGRWAEVFDLVNGLH